jgi:hypothetical protein
MWLREDIYDVEQAWAYNLSPRLNSEIRKSSSSISS